VSAGFLLIAISGFKVCRLVQSQKFSQKSNKLQHTNLFPGKLSSGLLLGAAIIRLIITPKPFASDAAIHRGVGDNLGAVRSLPQSFRASKYKCDRPALKSL
jgi:uncharacterized membrane protein YcgQ (UPF0703/DUF1980 family)